MTYRTISYCVQEGCNCLHRGGVIIAKSHRLCDVRGTGISGEYVTRLERQRSQGAPWERIDAQGRLIKEDL